VQFCDAGDGAAQVAVRPLAGDPEPLPEELRLDLHVAAGGAQADADDSLHFRTSSRSIVPQPAWTVTPPAVAVQDSTPDLEVERDLLPQQRGQVRLLVPADRSVDPALLDCDLRILEAEAGEEGAVGIADGGAGRDLFQQLDVDLEAWVGDFERMGDQQSG